MVWSGVQSPMSNEFDTTRVPGFRSRIFGRSRRLMSGSRNRVITVALEMSACEQVALDEGRKLGRRRPPWRYPAPDSTMFGLNSTPSRGHAALGGSDDRAAVAGAEVHQEVARHDLGHVEHAVDQRLRRRHPDHVLAGLADARLEFFRERSAGHDRRPPGTKAQTIARKTAITSLTVSNECVTPCAAPRGIAARAGH